MDVTKTKRMKSIEEKAKAYDEAIKRGLDYIRQTPATEMVTRQSILEHIFPELKESEDEKIRKAIHIYLDWLDGRNKDYHPKGVYTIKDMIAWLEKQGEQNLIMAKSPQLGEQKPAWSEEDEVMIKVFDSIIRYIVEVVDKDTLERFGTKREELFSWFKSLKDRVQSKQELSEND